jgi:hypothetical protein
MPEITSHITVRPDSIEIGTPSKGGALKIYFDSGDPLDSEHRIREAFRLRDIAHSLSAERAAA